MNIFSAIMDKIFHHPAAKAPASPAPVAPAAQAPAATPAAPQASAASAIAKPAPQQPVDVEAVLSQIAAEKGGGGNWRSSIVDLLKMLDLDSSLDARKQLAQELSVRAGADGTAEENIALHEAVMKKLSENGGKVPEALKQTGA